MDVIALQSAKADTRRTFGIVTPEQFGAKGDGKFLFDGITNGTTTFRSTAAAMTSADVGKVLWVRNGTAAGSDFTTAIASVSGGIATTAAAIPATMASGAWACIGTDDTAAIQAAMDWCDTYGGTVQFRQAVYIVASAPRTDRGGNAVLAFQNHSQAHNSGPTVALRGVCDMQHAMIDSYVFGTTIFCPLVGLTYSGTYGPPSVIGGPTQEQNGSAFSVVNADIRDIYLITPQNPSLGGIDLSHCTRGHVDGMHVSIAQQQANVPACTNLHAFGVRWPGRSNYERVTCGVVVIDGYYLGASFAEHFVAKQVSVNRCIVGLYPVAAAHAGNIGYYSVSLTKYHIASWAPNVGFQGETAKANINISTMDCEDYNATNWPLVAHVYDPNSRYRGRIGYQRVLGDQGSGGQLTSKLRVNGGKGLVLVDLTSVGRVLDYSATQAHGSLAGKTPPNMVARDATWGNALSFAGDDSTDTGACCVDCGPIPITTSAYTLEAWIKRTTTGGFQSIVGKYATAATDHLLFLDTAGNVKFSHSTSGGSALSATGPAAITDTTTWHHVAAVWDGTNLQVYVDGTRGTQTAASTHVTSDLITPTRIGAAADGASPFIGVIDEVRISNTARYSGTTLTVPTGPFAPDANTLGLWHMDVIH